MTTIPTATRSPPARAWRCATARRPTTASRRRQRPTSSRLPMTVKVLLENLLRHAGGGIVAESDVRALAAWRRAPASEAEVPVPARARASCRTSRACPRWSTWPRCATRWRPWAAIRRASTRSCPPTWSSTTRSRWIARPPTTRSPSTSTASTSATASATSSCAGRRRAFRDLRVVPPGTGIVHQVNLEYLATVVQRRIAADGSAVAFPDTLVGTDSHTTMINGLGVLGYGVGGIEAEAVLLGQPLYQPMPRVVGVRLHGELPLGATATDLVLVVSQMLRGHGVVGAFVEFAGDGLALLALADRATISNMSPEFGATAALFPIDEETLRLPAPDRPRTRRSSIWSSATPRTRASGAGRAACPSSTRRWSSTWPPSSPAWPARVGRRIGCRWASLKAAFRAAFPDGLEGDACRSVPADRALRGRGRQRADPADAAARPGARRPLDGRAGAAAVPPAARRGAATRRSTGGGRRAAAGACAPARWSSPPSPAAPTPPTRR